MNAAWRDMAKPKPRSINEIRVITDWKVNHIPASAELSFDVTMGMSNIAIPVVHPCWNHPARVAALAG